MVGTSVVYKKNLCERITKTYLFVLTIFLGPDSLHVGRAATDHGLSAMSGVRQDEYRVSRVGPQVRQRVRSGGAPTDVHGVELKLARRPVSHFDVISVHQLFPRQQLKSTIYYLKNLSPGMCGSGLNNFGRIKVTFEELETQALFKQCKIMRNNL